LLGALGDVLGGPGLGLLFGALSGEVPTGAAPTSGVDWGMIAVAAIIGVVVICVVAAVLYFHNKRKAEEKQPAVKQYAAVAPLVLA